MIEACVFNFGTKIYEKHHYLNGKITNERKKKKKELGIFDKYLMN